MRLPGSSALLRWLLAATLVSAPSALAARRGAPKANTDPPAASTPAPTTAPPATSGPATSGPAAAEPGAAEPGAGSPPQETGMNLEDEFSTELGPTTVMDPDAPDREGSAYVPRAGSALLTGSNFSLGGGYLQRLDVTGATAGDQFLLRAAPPALVDLFLNVQPSATIRGYLLTRIAFDPTAFGRTAPQFLLDQLWFRGQAFDHLFITAGRQQLKWGSGRVWNPTDFLRKINATPLEVYDLRTGTDMVRVHVPVDAFQTNLYAIGYVDQEGAASQPFRYGGAVRAEFVVGPGEVSASAVFQQQRRPRYGLDLNFGVGQFDIYAELALLQDFPRRLWRVGTNGAFEQRPFPDLAVQATAGAMTRLRVADLYQVILRAELFYNGLGYLDRGLLAWVVSSGDYQPLYYGTHYLMLQVDMTRRSPLEPGLVLTTIASLTDRSFFSRLDGRFVTSLGVVFGGYVEVPWGEMGGEFRFQPQATNPDQPITGLTLFRVGVYGRMGF